MSVFVYYFTKAADYSQQSIIVTIAPGTVVQQFTINITNDDIIECNETFYLSISTEGSWCGLNNSNGTAQVTIIDDDDDSKNMYVIILHIYYSYS